MKQVLEWLALAALVLLCAVPSSNAQSPNVLVIVLDDVGVDRIRAYGEHPNPGRTPNIDALADDGLLFRNCWVNPVCSSTRASILTGRYGFRTGVLFVISPTNEWPPLSLDEDIIPELLPPEYASAALGKWHLGKLDDDHPNESGFPHYAGSRNNLSGGPIGYFEWRKVVNGDHSTVFKYATTDTTDDAVAFMDGTEDPWFLWCSFNASHIPYHVPPLRLHTIDVGFPPDSNPPQTHRAMTQAVDTEIGRLIESVPPETVIILIGDNGTQKDATDAPFIPQHAKGSLFEGGINVPLIISGVGVRRGECDALVNGTDLFATILELTGATSSAEDSVSLVPYLSNPRRPSIRKWVYADRPESRAVRDRRYKLIRTDDLPDQLYDLKADPFESVDLLAQPFIKAESLRPRDRLSNILNGLATEW